MASFRDRIIRLAESKIQESVKVNPAKSPFAMIKVDRKARGKPKLSKDIRQAMVAMSEQALTILWNHKQSLAETEAAALDALSPEERDAHTIHQGIEGHIRAHQAHLDQAGSLKDFISAPSHKGRGSGHPDIQGHHGEAVKILKSAQAKVISDPHSAEDVLYSLRKAGLIQGNASDIQAHPIIQAAEAQRKKFDDARKGKYLKPVGASKSLRKPSSGEDLPDEGKLTDLIRNRRELAQRIAAEKPRDAEKHETMRKKARTLYSAWHRHQISKHDQEMGPHPENMTKKERHNQFAADLDARGGAESKDLAKHVFSHGVDNHELDVDAKA